MNITHIVRVFQNYVQLLDIDLLRRIMTIALYLENIIFYIENYGYFPDLTGCCLCKYSAYDDCPNPSNTSFMKSMCPICSKLVNYKGEK
jgi:hypothetical protein